MQMRRLILSVLCAAVWANVAMAVAGRNTNARSAVSQTASPAAAYNYNYMYPYMNNQMRVELNPGTSPSLNANPISVIARTEELGPRRRVVPRTSARSAVAQPAQGAVATYSAPTTAARAATSNGATARAGATGATKKRVVPRTNTARAARVDTSVAGATYPNRGQVSATARAAANVPSSTGVTVSSTRCLADYTE